MSLERRAGKTPVITLLDRLGTGERYVLPKTQRYVGVPIELWSNGWLLELSPIGLALLMVLIELLGGKKAPRYAMQDRRAEYGLSADTWTRGTKELVDLDLLTTGHVYQGESYEHQRKRTTYWINEDRIIGLAAASVKAAESPSSRTLINFD